MVNSLARSGNTHTERHLSLGGGKFCNESESLNLQESSADISMGNQCKHYSSAPLIQSGDARRRDIPDERAGPLPET